MKDIIRNYVTLEELYPTFNLASVQSLITSYTAATPTLDNAFSDVLDLLADEYSDWFVGYVDKWFCPGVAMHLSQDDYTNISKKFIRSLSSIYCFTSDKYLYLLSLYAAQKANLMKQLTTTVGVVGDHRVNDTPQDSGTFTDDAHTSVYEENNSTTTTNSDPMTVMARIDEIQNKYMKVLKAWCDEFNCLFIAPYNEIEVEDSSDE